MIRFGRVLLVLVLASLLAAFLGALLLSVDGARFRPAIEQVASRRLGAAIRIDGPIALRLLPVPTLEAGSLRLTLPGGGGGAQSLRLQVALGPLLAGRLAPRDLVLRRPQLKLPWPPPLPARLAAPEFSARIEDGALTLGSLALTALDAALTTDPQTGTAAMVGSVRLAGRPWRASASLGRHGGDGSAGLRVTLDDGGPAGLAASLSGQVAANGTLSGRVAAHGNDLSQVLAAPAVAFAAEGRLTAAGGLITVDDVSAELDGIPAHGAIACRLLPRPRLDITLATTRLELDRWLAPVRNGQAEPLLLALPVGLTVSAEAATVGTATLRALRASLDADKSGAALRHLEAVLPGEAPVHVAGRLRRDGAGRLRFEGDGQLIAPDAVSVGGWLAQAGLLPPGAFPATAPHTLGVDVAAAIGFDGDRLHLEGVRGQIDGSAIAGSLTLRRARDSRPSVAAALHLNRLDLDRWLPSGWPDGAVPPLDAELQLEAAAASLRGVALGPLRVDVGESQGDVTLRRFEAATAAGALAASGTLSTSGRLSAAHLALDLRQLGALLPWHLPGGLGNLPVAVRVAASGRPEALSTQLDATLGTLTIAASPRLDLAGAAIAWDGPVRLQAPSARRWLAAAELGDFAWLGDGSLGAEADIQASAERVTLGSLQASLGALRGGGALQLDLTGPEPALSGRVVAERLQLPGLPARRDDPLPLGGLRGWNAKLAVEAAQVAQPDLPVMTQVSGELALANGLLRLTGLRARVADGALTGGAELVTAAQPPRLTVQLTMRDLAVDGGLTGMPVDVVAGRLDGAATLTGSGHSIAALLATADGTAQLDLRDGVLQGIAARDLPPALPDSAATLALGGGRTPGLRGGIAVRLDSGALAIAAARLTAPGVALGLTGGIDLAAASANLRWSVRPDLPGAPELGLRLTGRLPGLERSPELAKLAQWRVGTLAH